MAPAPIATHTGAPEGAGTSQVRHPSNGVGRVQQLDKTKNLRKRTTIHTHKVRDALLACAAVRVRRENRRRSSVLTAGAIAALAAAATVAAAPPTADELRRANAAIAAQSRSATLSLYSIESQLARARQRLGLLRVRQAELEREQLSAQMQLRIARRAVRISRTQLAQRLRALYEQEGSDPLAVILGASSLDDAVARLDDIDRAADQNRDVIEQALAARDELRELKRTLARRQAQVASAAAAVGATAARLDGARSARTSLIARLARQRRLNAAQIAALEAAARAAELRATAINHQVAPAPAAPLAPAGARTLAVAATGYALSGSTATGIAAGWGVVAVDPAVIPLGTHMTIPGYGEGVAADTGDGVHGAAIDLWFPSQEQARAWGRRVVTITLH